ARGRQPGAELPRRRERPRAEIFASRLGRPAGLVVYLQSIEHAGQTWHRVLLGNFEDLQAASAYASSAQENGTYTYAQAVRVPRAGLLTWDGE
ncbi:MAG: SPOR domain-containing protein, partial [Candidatus Krumholzibacteriia bacterium]